MDTRWNVFESFEAGRLGILTIWLAVQRELDWVDDASRPIKKVG